MDRAVFDRDDLLARVGEDGRLARELVETFVASSPELLIRIDAALESGDVAGIERAAHSLRGALAGISAGDAAQAAAALERLARQDDLVACRSAARDVRQRLGRLGDALGKYLRGSA